VYLDSSVLVKVYVRESDTAECLNVIGRQLISSSEMAYGELASALLQKERAGYITPGIRTAVWKTFLADVAARSIQLMDLNGNTVRDAADIMLQVHPVVPLRTLDALHLATFQSIIAGPLYTKDRRMIDAARLLNFPLAD
jgi:predicted nucleic acid-binding protein